MTGVSDDLKAKASEIDNEAHPPAPEPTPDTETPEQEPEEVSTGLPPTSEILAQLLQPAAMILAPNWNLQAQEIGALADAWAPVIDKYFPDMNLGVEMSAALVTLAIIGPRLSIPPKLQPVQEDGGGDE